MTDSSKIYTLGVTGGIGSGKSTACQFFEELGAQIFYADIEARRIMEEDEQVRAEIEDAFGSESYLPDGHLNRSYLAGLVFGSEAHRAHLNAIVHPRVRYAYVQAKEKAERSGVAVLVYEAALIFETGGEKILDAVAVIDAPEEVRIRRVMHRDNLIEEQVHARMQTQLPAEELRRRADFLIENAGSLTELRRQVEALQITITSGVA